MIFLILELRLRGTNLILFGCGEGTFNGPYIWTREEGKMNRLGGVREIEKNEILIETSKYER